jgi:hypothetical protein
MYETVKAALGTGNVPINEFEARTPKADKGEFSLKADSSHQTFAWCQGFVLYRDLGLQAVRVIPG